MRVLIGIVFVIGFLFLLSNCKEEEVRKKEEHTSKGKDDFKEPDTVSTLPADTTTLPADTTKFPVDTSFVEEDSRGKQIPEYLVPEVNIYSHYTYLPEQYDSTQRYPLILFLHGSGERSMREGDSLELPKVLRTGVPELIERKVWNPGFPAIVVSPQTHQSNWKPENVHRFIQYILAKYNIDTERIYLTGLSMGGIGVFEYIGQYGKDSSYVAAAVPICGGGDETKGRSFHNIPIWAFHGEADDVVSVNHSKEMIKAINLDSPLYKAKLTIFPGVGHISWNMVYDGSGMGKESKFYDLFSEDVFAWMYRFKKGILPPIDEKDSVVIK